MLLTLGMVVGGQEINSPGDVVKNEHHWSSRQDHPRFYVVSCENGACDTTDCANKKFLGLGKKVARVVAHGTHGQNPPLNPEEPLCKTVEFGSQADLTKDMGAGPTTILRYSAFAKEPAFGAKNASQGPRRAEAPNQNPPLRTIP